MVLTTMVAVGLAVVADKVAVVVDKVADNVVTDDVAVMVIHLCRIGGYWFEMLDGLLQTGNGELGNRI